MRRKAYQPNKRAHKSEEGFYKDLAQRQYVEKVKRQKEKYDKEVIHYNGLLDDLVKLAMSKINSDSTPEDIQQYFNSGDAAWKIICARVRKTSSVISLRIDAFKFKLVDELDKKYETSKPETDGPEQPVN
jgi:hypothetical protein